MHERESEDPAERASESEFRSHVEASLGDLPETYSETLRAYLAEGLGPAEIARRFGISANAASVRIHRGLKLLRKALPVGFALGAAATTAPLALGSVRQAVLARAASKLGTTPLLTGSSSLALTGGLLMSTKLKAIAIAAVCLCGSLIWMKSSSGDEGPDLARDHDSSVTLTVPKDSSTPELASVASVPREVESEREGVAVVSSDGEEWRISLRVTDHETSRGLPNARVFERTKGQRTLIGRTDEKGTLEFRSTLDIEERLYIDAPGYAPFRSPRRAEDRERLASEVSRSIDHERQTLSYWDIRLRRGARVAGRVGYSEDGAPAVKAKLFLFEGQLDGPASVADEALAITDDAGRFELDGRVAWMLRQNTDYVLFAYDGSRLGWTQLSVLDGHEDLADVEIQLHPRMHLGVIIQTEAGEPLEGVEVTCVPQMGPWSLQSGSIRAELVSRGPAPREFIELFQKRSDAKGHVSFMVLPTRETSNSTIRVGTEWKPLFQHHVSFDKPGWQIEDELKGMRWDVPNHLIVTATPIRELTLRGRVLDHEGAPMADSTVSITGLERIRTESDGTFEVERLRVESFPLKVTSIPNNSPLETRIIELPTGDEAEVSIRHKEPVGLRVAVLDQFGAPYNDVSLSATQGELGLIGRGWDPVGYFNFPEASIGVWEVFARDRSYQIVASGEFETGDTIHEFVVQRPVTAPSIRLEARIVDGVSGAELAPSRATLTALDERALQAKTPTPKRHAGSVTLDALPLGRWMLEVWVEGYAQAWHVIEAEEEGAELLTSVSMHHRVDVTGHVDFGDVERPEHSYVLCSLSIDALANSVQGTMAQRSMILWIDPEGEFKVGGLEPGPWKFTLAGERVWAETQEIEVRPGVASRASRSWRNGADSSVSKWTPRSKTRSRSSRRAPRAESGARPVWRTCAIRISRSGSPCRPENTSTSCAFARTAQGRSPTTWPSPSGGRHP